MVKSRRSASLTMSPKVLSRSTRPCSSDSSRAASVSASSSSPGATRSPATSATPARHVLAYSVTLFLQSLPYSSLRFAGCDPYVAYELTLWLLTALGYASMIGLLRGLTGSRGFAVLGAVLFTYSNLFHSRALPQAYTVMLVPLFCLLMLKGVRAAAGGAASAGAWLGAAGALLALILFSDFYTGWFLLFFAAITATIACVIHRRGARRCLTFMGAHRRAFLCGGAAAVLALVPFLITYGPAIAAGHGRSYAEVAPNTMALGDLFNVSTRNLAWGWLMGRLDPSFANFGWDYGLPPGLLLAFAVLCGVLLCQAAARSV